MLRCLTQDHETKPNHFCHRLWQCLPSRTIVVHLHASETLYTCGEQDNNIYLIESGRVKILMVSRDGKECLLDICTDKDIVGESCMVGAERVETVTAMTPTKLILIPRSQFLEIIFDNGLVEEFLQYLAAKVSEQQQIITHFVTADSEQRLAATLLRLGRKIGTRYQGMLRIHEKITHEELAEIVGTTRSRVGYFLKRFRDEGLITSAPDSFLVIDEQLLDEYVQAWS